MAEFVESKVNPANKGFKDLKVQPVSFGSKAAEHVAEIYFQYNNHFETKREQANA